LPKKRENKYLLLENLTLNFTQDPGSFII